LIEPIDIIKEFYRPDTQGYETLVRHSEQVTQKALETADKVPHLDPDRIFIAEAAMLHDIGIFMTDAKILGCSGDHPYLQHGTLGREILDKKGLPRHAMVCERHVGVGISAEDIVTHGLPLPVRDMRPVSIDEQIICYADKFFSKNGNGGGREKTIAEILQEIGSYGPDKIKRFKQWLALFGG
jgi:uncharacterized protein